MLQSRTRMREILSYGSRTGAEKGVYLSDMSGVCLYSKSGEQHLIYFLTLLKSVNFLSATLYQDY